jgi:hypothetical protein
MIAKTMNGFPQDQVEREKERRMTERMDGEGLQAVQHADTT